MLPSSPFRTLGRHLSILGLVGAFLSGAPVHAPAMGQESAPEAELKAVFLHNFGQYVVWPESVRNGEDLRVCTLGETDVRRALEGVVRDPGVDGGRVRVASGFDETGAESCHILFIADSEKEGLPSLLSRLEGRSVLTVSDMEGFIEAGGMIRFLRKENRLRFEINTESARRAHLKIRGRLLSLAVRVLGGPEAGWRPDRAPVIPPARPGTGGGG